MERMESVGESHRKQGLVGYQEDFYQVHGLKVNPALFLPSQQLPTTTQKCPLLCPLSSLLSHPSQLDEEWERPNTRSWGHDRAYNSGAQGRLKILRLKT